MSWLALPTRCAASWDALDAGRRQHRPGLEKAVRDAQAAYDAALTQLTDARQKRMQAKLDKAAPLEKLAPL